MASLPRGGGHYSTITFEAVPASRLHAIEEPLPLEEVLIKRNTRADEPAVPVRV